MGKSNPLIGIVVFIALVFAVCILDPLWRHSVEDSLPDVTISSRCDLSMYITEYSGSSAAGNKTFLHNGHYFTVIQLNSDKLLVLDDESCRPLEDESAAEVLESYHLIFDSPAKTHYETFKSMRDKYFLADSATSACKIFAGVNTFLGSTTAELVDSNPQLAVGLTAALAPYGWRVETAAVAGGAADFIEAGRSTEGGIALYLAEKSSCFVANLSIASAYEYSHAGALISAESIKQKKGYPNESVVLSTVATNLAVHLTSYDSSTANSIRYSADWYSSIPSTSSVEAQNYLHWIGECHKNADDARTALELISTDLRLEYLLYPEYWADLRDAYGTLWKTYDIHSKGLYVSSEATTRDAITKFEVINGREFGNGFFVRVGAVVIIVLLIFYSNGKRKQTGEAFS